MTLDILAALAVIVVAALVYVAVARGIADEGGDVDDRTDDERRST